MTKRDHDLPCHTSYCREQMGIVTGHKKRAIFRFSAVSFMISPVNLQYLGNSWGHLYDFSEIEKKDT